MLKPQKQMKFSTFHLFNRFPGMSDRDVYDYHLEVIDLVEKSNFHGVFVAEHHFRDYGVVPSVSGMLSYIAARTKRIRLGSGITVLPLHNPVHIAEEMAQLDVLSRGRVEFGVGRGYQSIEFGGFGIDLSEARERFDESLDVILGMWTKQGFTHDGKYYKLGDVRLEPMPLQRPHPPIKVAAVSPETVVLYAKRGIPILADPASSFSKVERAAKTWHETAGEAGHDHKDAELGIMRLVHVAPTVEQARADMDRYDVLNERSRVFNDQSAPLDPKTGKIAQGFEYWNRYSKNAGVSQEFRWNEQEVIGDPQRVIERVKQLQSFGYSHLLCDFGSSTNIPLAEMKRTVQLFSDAVIPAFAEAAMV